MAERLVLEASVCGFESHLHHWVIMSVKCSGYARDPAKVEDQVRFLTWTLMETTWLASVMDSHDSLRNC